MISTQLELLLNKVNDEMITANNTRDMHYSSAVSFAYNNMSTMISTEMAKTPDAQQFNNHIAQAALRSFGKNIPAAYIHALKYADYFSDVGKTFLSNVCAAILDDSFDIMSCNNYKILEYVLYTNLAHVVSTWRVKHTEIKYANDIAEYNNLISKYNFSFAPYNAHDHYCKYINLFEKADMYLKNIIVWIRNKAQEYKALNIKAPTVKPVQSSVQSPMQQKITMQHLDTLNVKGLKDLCIKLKIPLKASMKRKDYIDALLKVK